MNVHDIRIILDFEFVAGQFAEQISALVNVTEDDTIFVAENVSGLQICFVYASYCCTYL